MKVTAVIAADDVGGAERYLELLLSRLAHVGHEVGILGRLPNAGTIPVTPVHVGPKWSRRTLARSLRHGRRERGDYLRAARTLRPDVFHLQFKREQVLLTQDLAAIAPVVWTEHGVWPSSAYGRALGLAYRRASAYVDAIVCVSGAVARSLRDDVGVDPAKLTVIDNPVDTGEYAPDTSRREAIRRRMGISDEQVVVVTTSRLEGPKGIDRVIDALRWLPPQYRVLVVGDGSRRTELEARAAPVADRVTFAGFRSDVADLLRAADVFVLPSRPEAREGSPLSLLQALATGLPQVVTADAGVDTSDRASSIVADPDPRRLAEAVERAWSRHDELGRTALAERERHGVDPWLALHLAVLTEVR